jgi:Amidase
LAETVAEILDAYRAGAAKPEDIVARSFARIRAHNDPAIFIALRAEADVLTEARSLGDIGEKTRPLYGISVSAKDNIDVKGLPTTALRVRRTVIVPTGMRSPFRISRRIDAAAQIAGFGPLSGARAGIACKKLRLAFRAIDGPCEPKCCFFDKLLTVIWSSIGFCRPHHRIPSAWPDAML